MKQYFAKCKKEGELYVIYEIFADGAMCQITMQDGGVYSEFLKNEDFEIVETEITECPYTYEQHKYLWRLRYELYRAKKFSEEEFESKLNELYEKIRESSTFKNLKAGPRFIEVEQFEAFLKSLKEEGIDFGL
jgi:hypothetical protein